MSTQQIINLLLVGFGETLLITIVSSLLAYIFGLPLGVLLHVTSAQGLKPLPLANRILGAVVNFVRSIPFLILMIWIVPFTRLVVNTSIGIKGVIVPLIISATPFVARMVESSLQEVQGGVIEAARSMGATNWQIITKVLLPESKHSLLLGSAIAVTTILGYSAYAGFCGGGGLGAIAFNYGYKRYDDQLMFLTVILIAVILQVIQECGLRLAHKFDHRKK